VRDFDVFNSMLRCVLLFHLDLKRIHEFLFVYPVEIPLFCSSHSRMTTELETRINAFVNSLGGHILSFFGFRIIHQSRQRATMVDIQQLQ
jgi:hypothetical protein